MKRKTPKIIEAIPKLEDRFGKWTLTDNALAT